MFHLLRFYGSRAGNFQRPLLRRQLEHCRFASSTAPRLFDLVIIGGGIVGLASAYQIQRTFPLLRIAVVEKENKFAAHQSGRNSGVIHSGLYYKPGSQKANWCTKGRKLLIEFAEAHRIPYEICGKVVVATNESELPRLKQLYERGIANGLENLEQLTGAEVQRIEPSVTSAIAGLWVPQTGITHYPSVCAEYVRLVRSIQPKSEFFLNTEVLDIRKRGSGANIICSNDLVLQSQWRISCAGLHADRMLAMDREVSIPEKYRKMRIIGFRGDYYVINKDNQSKVKNLIYPVPDPNVPFLGVHFTRMMHREQSENGQLLPVEFMVECGPNAVMTWKREGYGKFDFSWGDSVEALKFPGTWFLLANNFKHAINEYSRAMSKTLFVRQLHRLIPSLESSSLEVGRSGIRAQMVDHHGKTVEDFIVVHGDNAVHVLNAPSPAATSSLAIAEAICDASAAMIRG